ncbi:hypothetical protein TRIUR3_09149 [Triticum urartu]|uniref:Uncharacterized protein n=1 Tax=Triticum urartu TaxID=4572 RepID=M7ZKK5_TRIUA|nr:hypothetical protein TRIUR3_09149 [Triticum urartu]
MSFLLPLMGIRHASADLPPVLHHLSIKLQSCCAGPDEMPGGQLKKAHLVKQDLNQVNQCTQDCPYPHQTLAALVMGHAV